jgi:hypothetical protein
MAGINSHRDLLAGVLERSESVGKLLRLLMRKLGEAD